MGPIHRLGSVRGLMTSITLALVGLSLTGCGDPQASDASTSSHANYVSTESQNFHLDVSGSTTLSKSVDEIVIQFKKQHQNATFTATASGSGDGFRRLLDGEADIARMSRDLKIDELELARTKSISIKPITIGFDGLSVVIHPSKADAIQGLSMDQLKAIFIDQQITRWSQLSSELAGPIQPVARNPKTSGTGSFFLKKIDDRKGATYPEDCLLFEHEDDIYQFILNNPNAISYVSVARLSPEIHAVPISYVGTDFVACNLAMIQEGAYPLSRPLNLVVQSPMTLEVAKFISFVLDEPGQKVIKDQGFVALN